MKYSEITVLTNAENAELVAYFLQEVCMDGVSIYDKNDLYNNPSWDYKDESAEAVYCDEVKVKGYCNKEDTQRVLNFLHKNLAHLKDAGSLSLFVDEVEGDAWVETWKKTFRPIETEKIVICPEWQSVQTDKKVLLLDTGIAFGTGQHETTAMCLAFAENLPLEGKRQRYFGIVRIASGRTYGGTCGHRQSGNANCPAQCKNKRAGRQVQHKNRQPHRADAG